MRTTRITQSGLVWVSGLLAILLLSGTPNPVEAGGSLNSGHLGRHFSHIGRQPGHHVGRHSSRQSTRHDRQKGLQRHHSKRDHGSSSHGRGLGRHIDDRHGSHKRDRHHGYRRGHSFSRGTHYPRYRRYGTTYIYRSSPGFVVYDDYDEDITSIASLEVTDLASGWALLEDGEARKALQVFTDEARSNPDAGMPKVGYALAAAALGDWKRGVWAMRRAARIDADALHYVAIGGELRQVVSRLIEDYGDEQYHRLPTKDAAFMRAALYYLLHEIAFAREALQTRDNRESTRNLSRLIEELGES